MGVIRGSLKSKRPCRPRFRGFESAIGIEIRYDGEEWRSFAVGGGMRMMLVEVG